MPNAGFKDLFSGHAQAYARFRPTYPPEMFAQLASLVKDHGAAWDCATGNGQAAVALAPYFDKIYATDASQKQLDQATLNLKVLYSVGTAESSGLAAQSVTLVTVAQAFHWFKHDAFFQEVRRVAKAGQSVLAIWVYNLARVDAQVDAVVDDYYNSIRQCWEPERRFVEEEYRSIAVPFTPLPAGTFHMHAENTLEQFIGYIGTWSGTQAARKALGKDPFASMTPALTAAWGDPKATRDIRWPLTELLFSL